MLSEVLNPLLKIISVNEEVVGAPHSSAEPAPKTNILLLGCIES
jgi:hypothetical protein